MSKNLITILITTGVGLVLAFCIGCESDAQTGAGVGALAGAGVGQLAGGDTESTLIGGAIGAGAGYMIGNESDKKKAKAERESLQYSTSTAIVNVTNSNGSVTPVRLTRQGAGYVGPKGEYYDRLPTSEQLKPVYGF